MPDSLPRLARRCLGAPASSPARRKQQLVQETVEKDPGPSEIRRYAVSGQIDWLEAKPDWTRLQAVGRVESIRPVVVDRIRELANPNFVLGNEHFAKRGSEVATMLGQRTWKGSPGRALHGEGGDGALPGGETGTARVALLVIEE